MFRMVLVGGLMWALFCGFPTLTFVHKKISPWAAGQLVVWDCLGLCFQIVAWYLPEIRPFHRSIARSKRAFRREKSLLQHYTKSSLEPFRLETGRGFVVKRHGRRVRNEPSSRLATKKAVDEMRKEWQSRSNWKSKSGLGMFGLEKVQPWGAQTMESFVFLL